MTVSEEIFNQRTLAKNLLEKAKAMAEMGYNLDALSALELAETALQRCMALQRGVAMPRIERLRTPLAQCPPRPAWMPDPVESPRCEVLEGEHYSA